MFLDLRVSGEDFKLKYGVPEFQEVSKNLPGAHGFVFPEYQPVAIHGDPIQASGQWELLDLYLPQQVILLSESVESLWGSPNMIWNPCA